VVWLSRFQFSVLGFFPFDQNTRASSEKDLAKNITHKKYAPVKLMSLDKDIGATAAGNGNSAIFRDVAASVAGSAACTYTGQPFGGINARISILSIDTDFNIFRSCLDTVKVRMQASSVAYSGPIDCLLRSVRAEGIAALW
jgi:hypothetical protein